MTGSDVLEANLRLLPAQGWLRAVPDESALARVTGPADQPVLQIRTGRDQWVAVHGRRDPLRDARHLIDTHFPPAAAPPTIGVVGGGAGFLPEALLDRPESPRVIVIEPHAVAARAMLSRRDWRMHLATGRLTIVVGPDYAGAADAWRHVAPPDQTPPCLEDPVLAREHAPLVARARDVLTRIAFDAAANARAERDLGARYAINTLANLPAVLGAPPLTSLAGRGRGRTAVITAAGPSLWRNLDEAARWRDRVVLIAADTTLRPLLARGIEPDYVVAVDPTAWNTRHLTGLGRIDRTCLVAEASVDPAAIDVCGTRRTFFRLADNIPWPWLLAQGIAIDRLDVWGSVLTAAWSLAELLACDAVWFLGADLAYTGRQPYTRGVTFEVDWARATQAGTPLRRLWQAHLRRRPLAHVTSVDGATVPTAPHLLAFRDWLLERSARSGRPVVNATGAGALVAAGAIALREPHALADLRMPATPFTAAPEAVAAHSGIARLREALRPASAARQALLDMAGNLCGPGRVEPLLERLSRAPGSLPSDRSGLEASAPHGTIMAAGWPFLPERLASWNSARAGRSPSWPPSPLEHDVAAATGATTSIWRHAMSLPRVLKAGGPRAPAYPDLLPREVRALLSLPWHPDAESCAIGLLAAAARLVDLRATLPLKWDAPETVAPGHDTTVAPVDRDRSGRRRLEREACVALAVLRTQAERLANGPAPQIDATCRLLDRIGDTRPDGAAIVRVRLTGAGTSRRVAGWLHASEVPAIVQGALIDDGEPGPLAVAWQTSAGDGVRLDIRTGPETSSALPVARGRVVDWLAVRDVEVPASPMGAPLPGTSRCLLTPRHAYASLYLDASGVVEAAAPWSVRIVGERHGRRWHVAWAHAGEPRVLVRATTGGPEIDTGIPGTPFTAWPDDDAVLVTTDQGLWSWSPDGGARRLTPLPPAAIVAVRPDTVQLDPIPLQDGRLRSVRLVEGWHVDRRTGTHVSRPLGPLGQAWGHDPGAACAATAHPESHVVALSSGETQRLMVWYRPRGVAWLGHTLAVWSVDGRVGLVPDAARAIRHHDALSR